MRGPRLFPSSSLRVFAGERGEGRLRVSPHYFRHPFLAVGIEVGPNGRRNKEEIYNKVLV